MKVLVAQSYLTLCNPRDYSPPGSSAHGIFQARMLECVAISYSRGSSWPREWAHISCVSSIGRQALHHCPAWEVKQVNTEPSWQTVMGHISVSFQGLVCYLCTSSQTKGVLKVKVGFTVTFPSVPYIHYSLQEAFHYDLLLLPIRSLQK